MSSPTGRYRVNLLAVLVLAGGFAVSGVAVHFVHGFQVKRNARDLLEQATQAEQEGHPDQAAGYLGEYLGLVPRDVDALARYGLLLDGLAKDGRSKLRVFFVFEDVLRRDGGRKDVRRQAARVALEVGRYSDAKVHLEVLLKDAAGDAELVRLLARCEAGALLFEKAAEQYARAVELAPGDAGLFEEYALLLRERLAEPESADGMIEALVAQAGRSLPARMTAARYFLRFGAPDKAEAHTQFILKELGGEGADELSLAADVALARGKAAEARRYLEEGLKRCPQDFGLVRGLARLELQDGRREAALKLLGPALENLPREAGDLWGLAGLLLDAGETERAGKVIDRLREAGRTTAADYFVARTLTQQGDWGAARQVLTKAQAGAGAGDLGRRIDLLLSECHRALGNPDERLKACRRALQSEPFWLPGRRALAAALAAAGKVDEAVAEYRKIVGRAPEARQLLADLLLAREMRRPAAEQRWEEVEPLVKGLTSAGPPSAEAKHLQARLLLAQGKLKEARALAEAERDRDPKQVPPWLLLAALEERQGRPEAVLPLLDEAERRAGARAEWELVRARSWVKDRRPEARNALAKIEQRLDKYPGPEQDLLRDGLAGAYAAAGEAAAAERLWRQLAQRQPNNLGVRFLLLELAVEAQQEGEADRLLTEVRRVEGGGGAYTAYGEAARHFLRARRGDTGAVAAARRWLRQAAAARPSWSRVPLLEAQLDELEGHRDHALPHYQAALHLGEARPPVVRRVLELLAQQGRYGEANALLRKLPEAAVSDGLGRLAAGLKLVGEGGEPGPAGEAARAEALRLAQKAVASGSKNHRDFLWLGQVAALAGRPQEAEQAFRRARELAEAEPETWVTLILFLAGHDARRAEAELAEAERKLAKGEAPLELAPCYEALGRVEKAEECYRAALAAKPDTPLVLRSAAGFYERIGHPEKAEPLLRRLLAPETKAPEETAAWARRTLAVGLAWGGNFRRFREALALVGAAGENRGAELEDRLARALVLATHPAHRQEAIRLFEGLTPAPASVPADFQLVWALLYEADGNWPKAKGRLRAVAVAHENSPAYVAAYARALLRHKQADEAERWVERLAKLSPREFSTVELRARVAQANGRPEEAVSVARAYAREKGARLAAAADLLESLGREQEAEASYRRYAATSQGPAGALPLALHLSRRGRVAEALDLCERAWGKCPPELAARCSVSVVRTDSATDDQARRVERWLEAAARQHPQSVALVSLLAELYDGRGRHAEALDVYRRVLRQDPHNVVALNNLACLLALMGDPGEEARRHIESAIAEAGPQPELLDTLALVHLRGGRAEPALKALRQAVAREPSAAKYFHLAQAHLLAGEQPAAKEAYQKALALGLKGPDLHKLEQPALAGLPGKLP